MDTSSYDPVRSFYIIQLSGDLEELEQYVLKINYTTFLNDNLVGFYHSSYENSNGQTRYVNKLHVRVCKHQ